MEEKKKRVRPSLTQMRELQAELAKVKEDYRLQLVTDKHLMVELEAVKLKLKKTNEQLFKVGLECGYAAIKVSDGYRREEVEILQEKLDECEARLESQIDSTSNLVKDCDLWRGKYLDVKKRLDEQVEGTSKLVAECDAWREKYRALKSDNKTLWASNKLMEAELERVRKANQSLNELNDERLFQIRQLENRGFLARVFNR